MKCPKCGNELSNKDLLVLDRESVRNMAKTMRKIELFLGNELGEKVVLK